MHIAILPDADRGMPRWGVAPNHGLDGRIGIVAPAAVAQPKARQRHAESASCTSGARFPCTSTPIWDVHPRIGTGNLERRSESWASDTNIDRLRDGRTHRGRPDFRRDPTRPEPHVWRKRPLSATFSCAQIAQSVNREESNEMARPNELGAPTASAHGAGIGEGSSLTRKTGLARLSSARDARRRPRSARALRLGARKCC